MIYFLPKVFGDELGSRGFYSVASDVEIGCRPSASQTPSTLIESQRWDIDANYKQELNVIMIVWIRKIRIKRLSA